MNGHLVDAWWFWVVQSGWQSALVGGVLLIIVAWGKRWPAPVRSTLLLIALCKFAMPPFWTAPTGLFSHFAVASPPSTFAVGGVRDAPLAAEASLDADRASVSGDGTSEVHDESPYSGATPLCVNEGSDDGRNHETNTASSIASRVSTAWDFATPSSWKSLLMILHLGGVVAILAWVAIEFRSIRRILAHARNVEDGPIRESLERVRGQFGLGRRARVLISDEIAGPLATGLWRPTVVLPESADRLLPRELDAVLVHELTHLRRGDAWLVWLQVLLCAAWWFHPVMWLVNRSLRRVREDCCDDAILLSGIATGSEYCDMLLRVAHAASSRRTDLLACQMAGRLHPLGQRLRRIMDARVRRSRRMSLAEMAIAAMLAAAFLPGLRAGAQSPRPGVPVVGNDRAAKTEALRSPSTPPSPADPFAQRLQKSVSLGRAYLAGTQNQDGSFSEFSDNENATFLGPGSRPQPRPGSNQIVGTTSLAILALLSSGMRPDDPIIGKGVEFLRKSPPPARLFFTYQASLEIAALVAAKQGDRDHEQIAALVRALVDSQFKTGSRSGMWSYERLNNNMEHADNSNTEFAIMGLSAGEAAGVVVDRAVWVRSADHFVDMQNADGGWGYRNQPSSTGSMTASAIASLEICRWKLAATQHPRLDACEIAIKRGVGWLDHYFAVGVNPGHGATWVTLYWVQIARAGHLTGTKRFGKHEWFREIATFAMDAQSLHDGSWRMHWGSSQSQLATSFVLLFFGDGFPGEIRAPTK
jgi:beta-lactamase regulating signal transducer with metallopeptidase domain